MSTLFWRERRPGVPFKEISWPIVCYTTTDAIISQQLLILVQCIGVMSTQKLFYTISVYTRPEYPTHSTPSKTEMNTGDIHNIHIIAVWYGLWVDQSDITHTNIMKCCL